MKKPCSVKRAGLFICSFLRDVFYAGSDKADEVGRCEEDLLSALARADADLFVISAGSVNVGGELLFHSDGRAAAADVSGEAGEVFHMEHDDAFVSADAGRRFQIELFFRRQAEHDRTSAVSPDDDGLEDHVRVEAESLRGVDAGEIVFIIFVIFCLIDDPRFVEDAHDICLFFMFHDQLFPSRIFYQRTQGPLLCQVERVAIPGGRAYNKTNAGGAERLRGGEPTL